MTRHTLDCCNDRPSALFNGSDGVLRAFDLVQKLLPGSCWAYGIGTGIDKVSFQTSYVYPSTEVFALSSKDNLARWQEWLCLD